MAERAGAIMRKYFSVSFQKFWALPKKPKLVKEEEMEALEKLTKNNNDEKMVP